MKRTMCLGLLATATALAGCSTPSQTSSRAVETRAGVALAALGPSSGGSDTFFFGAGDALGEEIFTVYVASLRSDQHYATGASEFPAD